MQLAFIKPTGFRMTTYFFSLRQLTANSKQTLPTALTVMRAFFQQCIYKKTFICTMLVTLLLEPYTKLTQINSWLYTNNNLLHYVYLVFQRENAAGVVVITSCCHKHILYKRYSVIDHYKVRSEIYPDI